MTREKLVECLRYCATADFGICGECPFREERKNAVRTCAADIMLTAAEMLEQEGVGIAEQFPTVDAVPVVHGHYGR